MDRPAIIQSIIRTILARYPATQAIYLFGSWGTEDEWPESDVDIAVLLPPLEAKHAGFMGMSDACTDLRRIVGKEVDLINLRDVPTVFQKEIIVSGRRIFSHNDVVSDEFEIRVLSSYQKLNEERAEVLAEGLATRRFYDI